MLCAPLHKVHFTETHHLLHSFDFHSPFNSLPSFQPFIIIISYSIKGTDTPSYASPTSNHTPDTTWNNTWPSDNYCTFSSSTRSTDSPSRLPTKAAPRTQFPDTIANKNQDNVSSKAATTHVPKSDESSPKARRARPPVWRGLPATAGGGIRSRKGCGENRQRRGLLLLHHCRAMHFFLHLRHCPFPLHRPSSSSSSSAPNDPPQPCTPISHT
mmetsp:Transcript_28133/g.59040  ORF Transcript_28133/g.59040 Transcript_28133/m.59040 type:complete len:213 (-) Transcript_28133:266-904(-)